MTNRIMLLAESNENTVSVRTVSARMKSPQHFYICYSYMFRLNPHRGEYNLYCFCYCRNFLDTHMKQAENGIRFITPFYFELFCIPDGGRIRITYPTGAYEDMTCRYIDEYHFKAGWDSIYHICQFTETMARRGNTIAPI